MAWTHTDAPEDDEVLVCIILSVPSEIWLIIRVFFIVIIHMITINVKSNDRLTTGLPLQEAAEAMRRQKFVARKAEVSPVPVR